MKIRLDQVDKPFDWQETLEVSDAELDRSTVVELGEVNCRGRISPMIEDFLLRFSLTYDQKLRCVRCLGPVALPVSTDGEFILHIGRTPTGGSQAETQERELSEEELGLLTLKSPELDTRPILIEQVQMAVPMKPLCKEDCAGLCASCGADLNAEACGCGEATDPRWGALAALRPGASDN